MTSTTAVRVRHPAVARARKPLPSNCSAVSGQSAEAFLVGAAAAGNTRLAGEIDVLLDLRAAHGDDALLAALHRAVAFKRWRAADVRSILATGTAAPTPRGPGRALVLDLPTLTPRSLNDYAMTDGQPDPDLDEESTGQDATVTAINRKVTP